MTTETEFGKIIVNGKTYNKDVIIDANGAVLWRTNIGVQYYGNQHTVCTEEIKYLIEEQKPQYLIIGTGQFGACRLEAGVSRTCEKNGVRLITKKTPEAIKEFDNISGKKLGLFHVTC